MFAHKHLAPRQNNPAELRAFEALCDRLGGFNPEISFESVDGFLAALAAGPQVPPADAWIPALCGDAFERACADPEDVAQARRTLGLRLKVLCDQLDPGALADDPGALRLDPLISEWTDADRDAVVQQGVVSAEDAAALLTGVEWAGGFLRGIEAFLALWIEPAEEADEAAVADAEAYRELIDQIAILLVPPSEEAYREHVAQYHPKGEPTRDDLLAEACWAAQDLRLYWLDRAPKPATRRVVATPGRNEPCPCGSGKKYKKCCGAAAG